MAGAWYLVNAGVIAEALKDQPDSTRRTVRDGIELLLQNPFELAPPLRCHPLRAPRPNLPPHEIWVAHLGDGWQITYMPKPAPGPPLMGKLVVARALVRLVLWTQP